MKIISEPVAFVKNIRKEISDDYWGDVISEIELTEDFTVDALKGLDEFSHAEIIFYFNKADEDKTLRTKRHPRGNSSYPETGVFAHRVKDRPNHIGLTIAEIVKVSGKTLIVKGLDAIDGTPVLDIKPVLKEFLPRKDIIQPDWSADLMKDYWK